MSGQIFISYRRDDDKYAAGRLYDRLSEHFPKNQIFIDVDNLEPGVDFVEAIEASVGSCDVLIAVIGKRWLISSDEEGKRRLDDPDDFVRLEISTALKRNIRVIPVLVDGALMPRSSELPDDLKLLIRRNALDVSHNRFNADLGHLIAALERVLEKADAERKLREEKKRLEAEAARRRAEAERQEAERREKERQKAEARPSAQAECLEAERREKNRLEAEQREKERLEAEARQRESEMIKGIPNPPYEPSPPSITYRQSTGVDQEEKAPPPIFQTIHSREGASSSQAEKPTITPSENKAKKKRLRAVALAVALITGIGALWFAERRERTVVLLAPTPMPPTTTGTPDILADEHYRRGVTFNDKGDSADAITEFTEAIRLNPNLASAYYLRSYAYRSLGQNDEAKADLAAARQLNHVQTPATNDKANADDHYRRGATFNDKGNYGAAISEFTEAIRLNSNLASAYYLRSYAYRKLGQIDKAEADLATARQLNRNVDHS